MKKTPLFTGAILTSFLLGSGLLLSNKQKIEEVKAIGETDMDAVALEAGEQLDTANMIYDDFSSGISMDRWVVKKQAWGNGDVSYNSGVIPENVMYNSTDDTVLFRALGDQYEDNDVNYDLHDTYGYAHDGVTGGGRVYSTNGTRTGGGIKSRDFYGPGRFEAKFKIAPVEGVCTAFWTYNYGTDGESNYNEMDFELPTYLSGDNKDDLYFNQIICTTYKSESNYRSQRVTNPVYLNDNQFHTYCLEWYYSNNTKMVKWFIDGNLIATYDNEEQISNHVGRVTLGVWVPGRSNFCGIPNFDKAYMELDYFKYTPFKNQNSVSTKCDSLNHYVETYTTITETPKQEFFANGNFNHGVSSFFNIAKDVAASHAHDYQEFNSSYGLKISGEGNPGESILRYTVPNIRGIKKLQYSLNYRGYGSTRVYADGVMILNSGTLASRNEWAEYTQELTFNSNQKVLRVEIVSESDDFGFFVDNASLKYIEGEQPTPPEPVDNPAHYAFFAKNNGKTTPTDYAEVTGSLNQEEGNEWKVSNFKYRTGSDGIKTLGIKPDSKVMTSTSGSYYYPIKTCLESNSLYTSSDNVAVLGMMFDVDNFTDVELSMYTYSGISGRKVHTLYSTNSGTSWALFNTTECNPSTKEDGLGVFKYNIKLAAGALEGQTVRLAFVLNEGNGTDMYRVNSVIINNYVHLKDALDGSLCSANSDAQLFIKHQYAILSSSELTSMNSETMSGYPQTYAEGYAYITSYWDNSGAGTNIMTTIKNHPDVLLIIIVVFASAICMGAVILSRGKKTIKK